MERGWRINEIDGNFCMENGDGDENENDAVLVVDRNRYYNGGSEVLFNSPISPSSSSSPLSCIEHRVSKFDTLAGVAIRYGVEVADVKKMNGLVTDLQMFALKSLQIPLPGRHPPSPALLSNGSYTPPSGQSHYGSRLMAVTNSPLSLHRKSRSLANCLVDEKGQPYAEAGEANSGRSSPKLVRRRQKSEDDFSHSAPVKLLNSSIISPITGKGLAQRPKASSRLAASVGGSAAMGHFDHYSYLIDDGFNGVKKSSSTSNLQDPDDAAIGIGTGTSLWSASKLQALSTAVMSGRRNKAALD